LSGHREICSHYLRSTVCVCRPGSKCALVSAIFVGRLATLHLRHFSIVSGGSPGRERILHSKLHIPARLAIHSSALARLFSQSSLYGGATHQLAELPDVRFGSKADILGALRHVRFTPKRWGNRPAACGELEDFWVLRLRLMVKRGHRCTGPKHQ